MTDPVRRIDFTTGDLSTGGDLDDLAISGDQIKMLRLERMSGSSAWGRIHMIDGRDIVLRFSVAKRSLVITAEED
jgi:hypothetical protein